MGRGWGYLKGEIRGKVRGGIYGLGVETPLTIIIIYKFEHLTQGAKGIRQWRINWCTSSMIIHKINPSVD